MHVNDATFDAAASEFRAGPGALEPSAVEEAITRAVARVPSDEAEHFILFVDQNLRALDSILFETWRSSPATLRFANATDLAAVLRRVRDRVAAKCGLTERHSEARLNPPAFQNAMGAFTEGVLGMFGGDEEARLAMVVSQIAFFVEPGRDVRDDALDFVAFVDALITWGPEAIDLAVWRASAGNLRLPYDEQVRLLRAARDRVAQRWGAVENRGATGWPRSGGGAPGRGATNEAES